MSRAGLYALGLGLISAAACRAPQASLADSVPRGTDAHPWVAEPQVACGPLADAETLGQDAEAWAALNPVEVCEQAYANPDEPGRTVALHAVRFADLQAAEAAMSAARPVPFTPFDAGDEGAWLDDGILIRIGPVVYVLRVRDEGAPGPPESAVFVWSQVERRMARIARAAP